jgi:two-component system response regulator HydG
MSVFLVVEDDRDFRELLAGVFEDAGHQVDKAHDGLQALEMIRARKYDVVLTDVMLPGKDGMTVLEEAKHSSPDTVVVVMTAYGTFDSAAKAMKLGAADFLQKPFSIPELEMRIEKATRLRSLTKELAYLRHTQEVIYKLEDIVGKSKAIQDVLDEVRRLANDSGPVFIKGETGTGRLLIAGAIHFNSGRSESGFIRVNCTVQNPDHLESDLFGHAKDAFPNAKNARIGRIEQANGGTIFIEEITEAPLEIQVKLLEFIEKGTFKRFGGSRDVSVDARIIASTSRVPEDQIKAGKLMPELISALSTNVINIPPLRERVEDIPLLADYFIERLRIEMDNGRALGITDAAVEKLKGYSWPGNIRELKNVLERALFTSDSTTLDVEDIQLTDEESAAGAVGLTDRKLKELEKEAVLEALEKTNYVQKEAAKLLGISKRVIHYKIQQFNIKHPRWIKNK